MRFNLLDVLLATASLAGAMVIGVGMVQLAGADPALGIATGGVFFFFCADVHTASRSKRRVSALNAELDALRSKYDALNGKAHRR